MSYYGLKDLYYFNQCVKASYDYFKCVSFHVTGFILFSNFISSLNLIQEQNLPADHMIRRSLIWFQAISLKESQLVGNVGLDLEVGNENAPSPVRIITPKQENKEDLNENIEVEPHVLELDGQQDLQLCSEIEESLPFGKDPEDIQASLSVGIWNDNDLISGLSGISSYDEYLEHIDQELSKIEAELVTILRVSTLVLDSKETPKNSKVQQTQELLESICGIRKRYAY